MRGGFLHNEILLRPIYDHFVAAGAVIAEEYPVRLGSDYGAIDLLVHISDHRLAIEAECTPDRVCSDVEKAIAARADGLYIVMPTARVSRAAQRTLADRVRRPTHILRVVVAPLGPTLSDIRRRYSASGPTAAQPALRSAAYIWRPEGTPQAKRKQTKEEK